MLVVELIEGYLDSLNTLDTAARRASDTPYLRWWIGHIGGLHAAALALDRIRTGLSAVMQGGRTPGAARHFLRALRRACAWGVTAGHLSVDPCRQVPIPKDQPRPIRALSVDEERALCDALGEPYASWVRIAVLTGLRQSEQFMLRWNDVHLDRGVLTVPSPSHGAVAEVALSPEAVTLFRGLRTQTESRWVFPDPKNPRQPIDPHRFYTLRWEAAWKQAGISRCAWKDLRHTCGRRLAEAGWTTTAISGFLRNVNQREALVYRAWDARRQTATQATPRPPSAESSTVTHFQAALLRDRSTHPFTFGELADLYAAHCLQQRPARRNFDGIRRRYYLVWEDRIATSIGKKDILAWSMGLERTPSTANKAMTLLRSLYNWATRMDLIETCNPATGIRRHRIPSRERVLSVPELKQLWRALPHLAPKYQAFFTLLLDTGARRGEALTLRWDNITEGPEIIPELGADSVFQVWRKPVTKNGDSQLLPLPRQTLAMLQRLPRLNQWVFPGQGGQHLSEASVQKQWELLRRRLSLDDVHIHDIRRTTASFLSRRGENIQTVMYVLNHRARGATSIYTRMSPQSIAPALQRQADFMRSLVDAPEPPSVVAPLSPAPVLPTLSDSEGLIWAQLQHSGVLNVRPAIEVAEWPG